MQMAMQQNIKQFLFKPSKLLTLVIQETRPKSAYSISTEFLSKIRLFLIDPIVLNDSFSNELH